MNATLADYVSFLRLHQLTREMWGLTSYGSLHLMIDHSTILGFRQLVFCVAAKLIIAHCYYLLYLHLPVVNGNMGDALLWRLLQPLFGNITSSIHSFIRSWSACR